jgi:hypothetical protein
MQIFQHHATGGQWHYCRCGAQGDMLQLIQSAKSCTLEVAIDLWIARGGKLPGGISPSKLLGYYQVQRRVSQAIVTGWRSSSALHLPSGQRLLRGLQIRTNRLVGWNKEGVELVAQASSAEALQTTLMGSKAGKTKPPTTGVVLDLSTSKRLFPKSWDTVIVVPFYDVPQRISSLWCCGGPADGDAVQIAADTMVNEQLYGKQEAGIAAHPEVFAGLEPLLLFSDVKTYLRLSFRSLELQPEPLPLAAYRSHPQLATCNWQMVANRRLLFYASQLTAELLQQVIEAGGELSMDCSLRTKGPADRFLENRQPWEVYDDCLRRALPWPQAVSRYFEKRDDQELDSLLEQLYLLPGVDLAAVLRQCPTKFRQRAERLSKRIRPYRTILQDAKLIEEREDGYYVRGLKEERICNAVIHLDQLVWYEKQQQAHYHGRLVFEGKEYPLQERRESLEKNLAGRLQDLLLKHQAGILQYSPGWSKRLLSIAKQLSQPQLLSGYDVAGWDDRQFVFPNYRLLSSGEVEDRHAYLATPTSPMDIPQPGELQPSVLDLAVQSASTVSRGFWTAYLTLLADLISPALNQPRFNVAAVGGASRRVLEVAATAMGCGRFDAATTNPQHWPLVCFGGSVSSLCGIATEMQLLSAVARGLTGSWTVLNLPVDAVFEPGLGVALRGLLPTFLQHLLRNNIHRLRSPQPLVAKLREELRNWITETYGFTPRGLDRVEKERSVWECGGTEPSQLLVAALWQLLDTEQLALQPFAIGPRRNCLWEGKRGLYVPKEVLFDCLRSRADVSISMLTDAWQSSGHLLAEKTAHGTSCWFVDRDWIANEFRRQQPVSSPASLQIADGT